MLLTKLHIPQTGKNLVQRSDLFEKLNEGLNRKLILISAPAGYGKSTLLCDWINEFKIPAAWFSIDKNDNDPVEFLKIIIAGIQNIHKDTGKSSFELLKSPIGIKTEYIVELLINDILKIDQEFLIVLDDFHLIESQEIFKIVSYLLEYLPEQLHIAISTRSDPLLPLARVRSRNELTEIRSIDLNFSANDISNFFNKKLKLGLSTDDIYLLESKTEGWIAGLQLTALSMQGRENISDYLKKLAGDNRYIMDYLIEEVLTIQPEEVKQFLLKTSVLEQFTGSLCDSVLQINNSQLILESLEMNNMFIVPLDDERKWFRYHHLFADLLKHRLSIKDNISLQEIHNNASSWFEKNEMITYAIEHALKSPDFERAMKLLNGKVESLWEKGQYSTIFNFGSALPEHIIKQNKQFCVHYSWTLVLFGKLAEAEKYLNYLESSIFENKDNQDVINENIIGKVYHTLTILNIFSRNIKAAFKYSEKAIQNLSDSDLIWNTWAVIAHGELFLSKFELQKSSNSFIYAISISKQSNNIYLTFISTIDLATVRKLEGKYNDTLMISKELIEKAGNSYIGNTKSIEILTSMLHSLIGFVLTEFNNIDEGLIHAHKGYELSRKAESESWFAYCALLLAEIYCKIGDRKKAFQFVHEVEKNDLLPQKMSATAFILKIKLYVLNDELDKASDLLNDSCNRKDIINEFEIYCLKIVKARFYIAKYKTEEALILLDEIALLAKKNGAQEMLIEVEVLKAKAFSIQNEKANALNSLINAIVLAQDEGFIRTFFNEGKEIEALIKEIRKIKSTRTSESLDLISSKYLNKLCSAFETEKKRNKNSFDITLSSRELDTLKLIAENLTNQEIADKLFISLNTVKTHLKNINLKLEASNRSHAVTRAKEIGLI